MRTVALLLLASFAFSEALFGNATAYQALRYATKREGDRVLEDVYLIRGAGGRPQPDQWVLFRGSRDAPYFRTTKVREDGRITTGKAAAWAQGLPPDALPLNLTILNLDTHAAWNIATRHAEREGFRFDCVDYELTTHPLARVPAWTMYLFNEPLGMVGIITLSGATGEVLNRLKLFYYTIEATGEIREIVTIRERWETRASRSIHRWFSRTGEAYGHDLYNATGSTEEILIQRRTRHFSEDAR
ncbi:MAG TPA: hypothetical protein VNQ90_09405 [Chthoniobacteraceae bacterium]|nr:hypothetical protein [Chthoniobacteraceae bacterium]